MQLGTHSTGKLPSQINLAHNPPSWSSTQCTFKRRVSECAARLISEWILCPGLFIWLFRSEAEHYSIWHFLVRFVEQARLLSQPDLYSWKGRQILFLTIIRRTKVKYSDESPLERLNPATMTPLTIQVVVVFIFSFNGVCPADPAPCTNIALSNFFLVLDIWELGHISWIPAVRKPSRNFGNRFQCSQSQEMLWKNTNVIDKMLQHLFPLCPQQCMIWSLSYKRYGCSSIVWKRYPLYHPIDFIKLIAT